MQHNEPGFGVAMEQLRRTPKDANAVGNAFSRVTGGSPVWADVGVQLTKDPRKAVELFGFTKEAAATHLDDKEAFDLFHHFQRELTDSMTAFVQSQGKDSDALHHAADQMNDLFIHHLSKPSVGKAAVAKHMTDEELSNFQTSIDAKSFGTPEMVGAWYNPFLKKKSSSASSSSSSSSSSTAAPATTTEKKPNVFTRVWRGAKKKVGQIASSGKKKTQQRQEAAGQSRSQQILQAMTVDSKLDILKNSRGNSATEVYAITGQIRQLSGRAPAKNTSSLVSLFGKIAPWPLPIAAGYEGLTEFGDEISMIGRIGPESEFEKPESVGKTWARLSGPGLLPDYLGFGSAGKLGHPKAQLFMWGFDEPSEFIWKSSDTIKIEAAFTQPTLAFGDITRFDFAAITEARSNFSYLGSTTRSQFVRGNIGDMDGYGDFESSLDDYDAKSVKVEGRKDPIVMLDGKESEAYKMWKSGQLFVLDLTQNLLQRSAALTPRFRVYCKIIGEVPKSWSSATTIKIGIVAVSLEIQIQSIALGYDVVQHYKKEYVGRQNAKKAASSTTVAAATSESSPSVIADQ